MQPFQSTETRPNAPQLQLINSGQLGYTALYEKEWNISKDANG